MLGLDRHRLGGHLSVDCWIAVAIAADPGPETEKRWSRRAQGGVKRAHQLRRDTKKRFVENGHERAHLVEWLDACRAHLRGPPQRIDLFAQPSVSLVPLAVGDAGIIEAL